MWKWLACGYNPDKPTEFYPILTRLNDGMKHEAFVVSNAPCDTCELRKVVEKYNFETWSLDTLKKYKALERIFYKETKYMTKDFREGDEYTYKICCTSSNRFAPNACHKHNISLSSLTKKT